MTDTNTPSSDALGATPDPADSNVTQVAISGPMPFTEGLARLLALPGITIQQAAFVALQMQRVLPPEDAAEQLCRDIEDDYWAHYDEGRPERSQLAIAGRL